MAQQEKSAELTERDALVLEMSAQGITQRKIGSTLGISGARVNQIIAGARDTIDPDATRAQLTDILEELTEGAIRLVRLPAPPIVSPSGKPVYHYQQNEDGTPVLDNRGRPVDDLSRPMVNEYARLEAHKIIVLQVQAISKMLGLDRKPQEKDNSGALAEVLTYMEQLELQNQQLRAENEGLKGDVTEGEIV